MNSPGHIWPTECVSPSLRGFLERKEEGAVVTVPTRGLMLQRAMQLTCPRCGEEKMFSGLFRMKRQCRHCGLKYEREPGYFLGSIYVNYGLTAVVTSFSYMFLRFGLDIGNWYILPWLLTFCILFPTFFFRYARAYWLAMDLSFDHTDLDPEQ